ncbi:MAG: DUF2062 domain-containing protein [Pirellulaceae bacterium]|nr:DUF2062 domain-containing protein [Pirellulaceae bacterium]
MKKKTAEFLANKWRRSREFIIHNILHADDPPHRLALGVGLAMFVTFTPTIGFQMGLVFALCWFLGGNKLVGLPLVWISNPATLVPIYYPCLWLGETLLGEPHRNFKSFKCIYSGAPDEWLPKVKYFGGTLKDMAIELWLGCIVVGGTLGILFYFITYWAVYSYRMRVWGQLTLPIRAASDASELSPEAVTISNEDAPSS